MWASMTMYAAWQAKTAKPPAHAGIMTRIYLSTDRIPKKMTKQDETGHLLFILLFYIATRNKCIATSNKCLTSSNKKLLVTTASLLVTSALLVVTRFATRNICFTFVCPF